MKQQKQNVQSLIPAAGTLSLQGLQELQSGNATNINLSSLNSPTTTSLNNQNDANFTSASLKQKQNFNGNLQKQRRHKSTQRNSHHNNVSVTIDETFSQSQKDASKQIDTTMNTNTNTNMMQMMNQKQHLPRLDKKDRYGGQRNNVHQRKLSAFTKDDNVLNFITASRKQQKQSTEKQGSLARRFFDNESVSQTLDRHQLSSEMTLAFENTLGIQNASQMRYHHSKKQPHHPQHHYKRHSLNSARKELNQSQVNNYNYASDDFTVDMGDIISDANSQKPLKLPAKALMQNPSKQSLFTEQNLSLLSPTARNQVREGAGTVSKAGISKLSVSPSMKSFGVFSHEINNLNKELDKKEIQTERELEASQHYQTSLHLNSQLNKAFRNAFQQVLAKLAGSHSSLESFMQRVSSGMADCFIKQDKLFRKQVETQRVQIEDLQQKLKQMSSEFEQFRNYESIDSYFVRFKSGVKRDKNTSLTQQGQQLLGQIQEFLDHRVVSSADVDFLKHLKDVEPSGAETLLSHALAQSSAPEPVQLPENPLKQVDAQKRKVMNEFKNALMQDSEVMRRQIESHVSKMSGIAKPSFSKETQTFTYEEIKQDIYFDAKNEIQSQYADIQELFQKQMKRKYEKQIQGLETRVKGQREKIADMSQRLRGSEGKEFIITMKEKVAIFFQNRLGGAQGQQLIEDFNEAVLNLDSLKAEQKTKKQADSESQSDNSSPDESEEENEIVEASKQTEQKVESKTSPAEVSSVGQDESQAQLQPSAQNENTPSQSEQKLASEEEEEVASQLQEPNSTAENSQKQDNQDELAADQANQKSIDGENIQEQKPQQKKDTGEKVKNKDEQDNYQQADENNQDEQEENVENSKGQLVDKQPVQRKFVETMSVGVGNTFAKFQLDQKVEKIQQIITLASEFIISDKKALETAPSSPTKASKKGSKGKQKPQASIPKKDPNALDKKLIQTYGSVLQGLTLIKPIEFEKKSDLQKQLDDQSKELGSKIDNFVKQLKLRLEQKTASVTKESEERIKTLKKEHDDQMKQLRGDQQYEKGSLENAHQNKLEELQLEFDGKMAEKEASIQTQIDEATQALRQQIEQQKSQFDNQAKDELQLSSSNLQKVQEELARVKESFQAGQDTIEKQQSVIEDYKGKLQTKTDKIGHLRNEIEQMDANRGDEDRYALKTAILKMASSKEIIDSNVSQDVQQLLDSNAVQLKNVHELTQIMSQIDQAIAWLTEADSMGGIQNLDWSLLNPQQPVKTNEQTVQHHAQKIEGGIEINMPGQGLQESTNKQMEAKIKHQQQETIDVDSVREVLRDNSVLEGVGGAAGEKQPMVIVVNEMEGRGSGNGDQNGQSQSRLQVFKKTPSIRDDVKSVEDEDAISPVKFMEKSKFKNQSEEGVNDDADQNQLEDAKNSRKMLKGASGRKKSKGLEREKSASKQQKDQATSSSPQQPHSKTNKGGNLIQLQQAQNLDSPKMNTKDNSPLKKDANNFNVIPIRIQPNKFKEIQRQGAAAVLLDPNQTLSSLRETGNFRGGAIGVLEADKKKVTEYIGPQNPPTVYVNTQGSIQKVVSPPPKSKNQPDRSNQFRQSVPDTDYIKTASNFNPGVRGVQIQNHQKMRHLIDIAPLNMKHKNGKGVIQQQQSPRDVNTQLDHQISSNIQEVHGHSIIQQDGRRENLRTQEGEVKGGGVTPLLSPQMQINSDLQHATSHAKNRQSPQNKKHSQSPKGYHENNSNLKIKVLHNAYYNPTHNQNQNHSDQNGQQTQLDVNGSSMGTGGGGAKGSQTNRIPIDLTNNQPISANNNHPIIGHQGGTQIGAVGSSSQQRQQMIMQQSQPRQPGQVLMLPQTTQTENRSFIKYLLRLINETMVKQLEERAVEMSGDEFAENYNKFAHVTQDVYNQIKGQSDTFFIKKELGIDFTTNDQQPAGFDSAQHSMERVTPPLDDLQHIIKHPRFKEHTRSNKPTNINQQNQPIRRPINQQYQFQHQYAAAAAHHQSPHQSPHRGLQNHQSASLLPVYVPQLQQPSPHLRHPSVQFDEAQNAHMHQSRHHRLSQSNLQNNDTNTYQHHRQMDRSQSLAQLSIQASAPQQWKAHLTQRNPQIYDRKEGSTQNLLHQWQNNNSRSNLLSKSPSQKDHLMLVMNDNYKRYGQHTLELGDEIKQRVSLKKVGGCGGGFLGTIERS